MKQIYKYPLEVVDAQTIILPRGAVLLDVQVQHNQPQLWALVDDSPGETLTVRTVGTGHPCNDVSDLNMRYLSTYQLEEGQLVFHVFVK